MIFKSAFSKITFSAVLISSLLTGCGGGSGDDNDFIGAANISMSASPTKVDTGDRLKVTINVSDVHSDGILLKVYFPVALKYVKNSSFLKAGSTTYDIGPDVDVDVSESLNSGHFLVYFFKRADFGKEQYGTLTFELEGKHYLKEGEIGVDPDVNDQTIPDNIEFDPSNPEYNAEASVMVRVSE